MSEATPPDTMAPQRRSRTGRGARKVGLFALAFLAMATIAVAAMVRFTGRRDAGSATTVAMPPATRAEVGQGGLVIPVQGVRTAQITDTWGQSRADGARAHQATDIMAAGGAPVIAAAAGIVEKLHESAAGGHTLYIRSDDGRWSYYYAHLAAYAPAAREGAHVAAGQHIGFVGDTGNAGLGNYHLHFAIARMAPGERWWQGTPVNPYPLLVGGRTSR